MNEFGGVVREIGLGIADRTAAETDEVDGAVGLLEGSRVERQVVHKNA